jgi:hypothetical protein
METFDIMMIGTTTLGIAATLISAVVDAANSGHSGAACHPQEHRKGTSGWDGRRRTVRREQLATTSIVGGMAMDL